MKIGDICVFKIYIKGEFYMVRCECWDDLTGKKAYENTFYNNKVEILHAGHGNKIDTYDKAHKAIKETIELRNMLLKVGNK